MSTESTPSIARMTLGHLNNNALLELQDQAYDRYLRATGDADSQNIPGDKAMKGIFIGMFSVGGGGIGMMVPSLLKDFAGVTLPADGAIGMAAVGAAVMLTVSAIILHRDNIRMKNLAQEATLDLNRVDAELAQRPSLNELVASRREKAREVDQANRKANEITPGQLVEALAVGGAMSAMATAARYPKV